MIIALPWPSRTLSPNARKHWRSRSAAVKCARRAGFYATKAARIAIAAGDVPVTLAMTFHPPDNRARDLDNAFASCKALIDGIADALGVDDRAFRYRLAWGAPERGGCVRVTVNEPLAQQGAEG